MGLSAALCSSLCTGLLYLLIQPNEPAVRVYTLVKKQISPGEIFGVTLFSSVFGTLADSFLGSLLEESWWCTKKQRITAFTPTSPACCQVARKDRKRVIGHNPQECGLVCGRQICSGSCVNMLSSSFIAGIVFWWFYVHY